MSVDPDCELIVKTTVSAGNFGDAAAAEELLADDLAPEPHAGEPSPSRPGRLTPSPSPAPGPTSPVMPGGWPSTATAPTAPARCWPCSNTPTRRSCARTQAADRGRRPVHQGRLPDRPHDRPRDLPGRADRAAARQRRDPMALLRNRLRDLPAGRPVHHQRQRPHDRRRPPRAPTGGRPHPPGRSRLAGRLQGHAPEGRTQASAHDAPPPAAPAAPASAARPRPPPTSHCSPPPSTSPASPCSDSPTTAAPGSRPPPDRGRPPAGP